MNVRCVIKVMVCVLVPAWTVFGQEASAERAKADLDLKRVTLFSSGVGYFEHGGNIDGDASVELQFRTPQINDILKSLVVQDFDGGSIDVVTYTPQDPLEHTLQSFGVNVIDNPSLIDLFKSLRGEPIAIAGPQKLDGIIYGTELVETRVGEEVVTRDMLNVLTDRGLIQFDITELEGVKLKDARTQEELNKALAALAKANDQDKKGVTIDFSGQGMRRVQTSFLLETPVWKTSYRLVLTDDEKPFLQGWAIVENTTDEDWENVRLSLISGRPISFRMDLYTPIYLQRPVEDLELYASLRAPQFETALGEVEERFAGGMGGFGGGGGAKAGRMQRAMAEDADGDGALYRKSRSGNVPARAAMQLGGQGVASVASAADAGELFEYAIDPPVSIRRQQSAMLPIVNASVDGEKVSIYSPQAHPKHPLNGLKFTNATELNLMQGPITVFDDDTYAGDAKLPDLKPGEDRFLAYALDLATEVSQEGKPVPTQMIGIRIRKGVMTRTRKEFDERTYTVRNKSEKDKSIILEQSYGRGWKMLEPEEPYERTEDKLRFKVDVEAGTSEKLTVRLEHVLSETVVLTSADLKTIQHYLSSSGSVMTKEIRDALEDLVARRNTLDNIVQRREATERDLKEVIEEQARVRQNLTVLERNTDASRRQLKKFDDLETRIETLRSQLAELREEEAQKRRDLENYLQNLTLGG